MTNKKKGLFLTLVAASAFVLSSCNEVTALPKFYEDPIILNDDGTKTDVYQNIMSLIYDALTSSSDNPKKVLDEMMYVIAVDQFGSFAEVEELAAKDANAAEVRTFIEAHDNVYRDENDAVADKVANEFARLVHFKDTMDYRIKEVFHDAATGGSYSKRSRFDEEKYAVSLVGDLYDIEGVFEDATVWYKDVLVTPDVEVEDIVDFVHIDRYQDYIERGVLPRLYREKLVEQFIYDNNYSSLGRTYAREVEYIKIVNNDAYPSAAKSLINAFVDKYILDVNAADEVDFEVLANAWRGINLSDDAVTTLLETAFTGTSVPVTDADVLAQLAGPSVYYPQTQFGSIAKDYLKITDDRFTNDTGIESDFTNSNAYTKQVGLTIKSDSLKLEDYTNDGWYVKSGGLSELPEAIRSRLFNINVANEVGSIEAEDATHSYESGQYVRNLRGEFYLTPTTSEQGTDVRKDNFVIYDISSSTYYIIKVKEAVSTSKLSRLSDNSYPTLEREDIAKEVTHVLSAKDSYINNAYESYIKLYSVIYHDTTIYDYFKEQFPDLFDDED